jgi:hypothetical protein
MCYSGQCRHESYPRGRNEGCVCKKHPNEDCPMNEERPFNINANDMSTGYRTGHAPTNILALADRQRDDHDYDSY